MHLMFHISNLKPLHIDLEDATHNKPTKTSVRVTTTAKREVEEILADKTTTITTPLIKEYLIKWKSSGAEKLVGKKLKTYNNTER